MIEVTVDGLSMESNSQYADKARRSPSSNNHGQSVEQGLQPHYRSEGSHALISSKRRGQSPDNSSNSLDGSTRGELAWPGNEEETINRTLVSDLQAHLDDTQISDVTLRGTDGRSVVAIRSILAMRSRYFKSLLFGNFQERNLSEVPLGFSSLVLRAVVEYCYTDEMKITFENLSFEETARSMVGLVAAGSYFELGGLLN
mmetsp:Transcript_24195/g.35848  ORF Transcript_24195/g.35848 Transcript_24195/m.35848 type:complete len:200 (-) Transcript_24195:598-1197(-)